MIDIGKIVKRAWNILWTYRILWIFGILLAITAGGGLGNGGQNGFQYQFNKNDWNWGDARYGNVPPELRNWVEQNLVPLFTHPEQYISTFIWIGVGILLFTLVVGVITAVVRYVSEIAVIRMVNGHEQTGQKVGFKQGWKLGWSRAAFRMWVIDLILSIPVIFLIGVIGATGLVIFSSVESSSEFINAAGTIASIGILFVFLFVFIIGMVFLGLLRQFFVREAALENASIGQSFRLGWQMFKRNWKSAGLMWLVMIGIGIGASIAGTIVFFLLIPAYVIMAIPAVFVAAVPGLLALGISSIFTGSPLTWIIGGLVATPFFFLVVFLPLSLVSGWYKIFSSSIWTLTYREMKALDVVPSEPAPEPAPAPAPVE